MRQLFTTQELIEVAPLFRGDVEGFHPTYIVQLVLDRQRTGPMWVARGRDNKIVGIGGIIIKTSKYVVAWTIMTPEVEKNAKTVYKACKKALQEVQVILKPWRVEAECAVNHTINCRFLEALGFEVESIMKYYGSSGEDYARYVILNKDGN